MSRTLAAPVADPAASPPAAPPAWGARPAAFAVLGVAAVALVVQRLWLAAILPLWFDEAWALAVARAPDWAGVIHEARVDTNAPLYDLLLHAWTQVAGASDLALRLPGMLAVAAAAALPLMRRVPGLTLGSRLALAGVLFAWWGIGVFLDGRCYGLLLALSVAQCFAFAGLIRKPSTGTALAWTTLASLAILTHYYAAIVTAAQGLAYLAVCRKQALRTWPAVLSFAPAAAWIAWHAPRLAAFAAPQVAWHSVVDGPSAIAMTGFILDPSSPALGLLSALALAVAFLLARGGPDADRRPLWIAAAASLAGLALTLASGMLHPSLTARYLIPVAPGLLLGLVLLAQGSARPRLATSALVGVYLLSALWPGAVADGLKRGAPYGFETASDVLMQHGVSDVVFAWDHEVAALMPPATLARVGGVFFRRAGSDARIRPLVIRPGDDVNALALATAAGPRPGIIWIYNRDGHTAAAVHPPRIAQLDPRWTCRRSGDERIGALACWRR